jgi:tripartite ATP-independent transporter DctP family solute receptor
MFGGLVMKRLLFLFLVITLVLTGAFAAGGGQRDTAAQQRVVVQIGLENHPGEPSTNGVHEWARLIEERSRGTMVAEVFPSSQMGTKDQLIDMMLAGMGVITLADGSFFADRGAPDTGITYGPYFFATWQEANNLVESSWWADQARILEGRGLKLLVSNWVYGERHTLTTRPIRSLEDFRGLRLRVPNNIVQVRGKEVMGASPTPLPLGEVYTALQQRVVDGVENPLPVLYGGRFHEVARYLTLTGHIKVLTTWFTGTIFWNTLTSEQQNILVQTGLDAGMFNNAAFEKAEAQMLDRFRAEGVEIIQPGPAIMESMQRAAAAFYTLPDITARWSPGLVERANRAKAGR